MAKEDVMQVAMMPAFPADLRPRLTKLLKGLLNVDNTKRWSAAMAQASLGLLMKLKGWQNDVFPPTSVPNC